MEKTCCETKGDFRQGSKVQGPMNSSNLLVESFKLVPTPLDRGGSKTKKWQIEANMALVLEGKSIGSEQKTVLKKRIHSPS
jgi:hypothetical protein